MKLWTALFAGFLIAGCNQNVEVVNTGETLENSPVPVVNPNDRPLAGAEEPGGVQTAEPEVPPFVKAYFMHTWVEALYGIPQNKNPNPNWQSPLVDPVNGRVWCTDCHVSGQVDFERIPKMRMPMVDRYENDKAFMADLMKKWVARLNSEEFKARAKLKQPVTCLTCHAENPEE
jgi:hypothetical protein